MGGIAVLGIDAPSENETASSVAQIIALKAGLDGRGDFINCWANMFLWGSDAFSTDVVHEATDIWVVVRGSDGCLFD